MKIAFHTTTVSPHQLPFARQLAARVGVDNYRYIYTRALADERRALGWQVEAGDVVLLADGSEEATEWLETADVLVTSLRECALIERRCQKGLLTFYTNERWFKPALPGFAGVDCALVQKFLAACGCLRFWVPGFRRVTKRMAALAQTYANFRLLPIGVHALEDYAWAGVPREKMDVWGYFVDCSIVRLGDCSIGCGNRTIEQSEQSNNNRTIEQSEQSNNSPHLRVLWVGRPIPLKRVRDIERACERVRKAGVDVALTVKTGVPIEEVRALMRAHDVYVLASNAYEGWGAVVSEALEEGMNVIGTCEAGAPATLLPADHLYHAGDVGALAALLEKAARGALDLDEGTRRKFASDWTATGAAERFLKLVDEHR